MKRSMVVIAVMFLLATLGIGCAGDQGNKGINGHAVVSTTTTIAAGSTVCATGGTAVTIATDVNDNLAYDAGDTTINIINICNGATGTPGINPSPFTITGVVTDNSGTALKDATVTVIGSGASATTDANGAFGFEVLASGTYTLSATTLTGYVFTNTQTATVSSTTGGTANFVSEAGQTFYSTDVPKDIPDNDIVTGATSTITVSGGTISISKVMVTLSITHTFDSDLLIYLVSPAGTQIELSTNNGGSGVNYTDTVFDDGAATLIINGTAPFTGTYGPEVTLSTLNGEDANGTWTLRVYDDAAADIGTLDAWSITFP